MAIVTPVRISAVPFISILYLCDSWGLGRSTHTLILKRGKKNDPADDCLGKYFRTNKRKHIFNSLWSINEPCYPYKVFKMKI